jgi:GAF domain-containing protein
MVLFFAEKRPFDEDELRLYLGLAAVLGNAVANAHLYEAQEQRRRRIEVLHGVLEAAVSSLDTSDSARRIMEYLTRNGFELANVWMARGDTLELLAAHGYPEEYARRFSPMPLSAPYDAPRVFRSGEPVVVEDAVDANPAVRELYRSIGVELGAYHPPAGIAREGRGDAVPGMARAATRCPRGRPARCRSGRSLP